MMNPGTLISEVLLAIEEHLHDKFLSPNMLAKQHFTSVSELQIMFRVLTGMTIKEYIRVRRLSIAGLSLRTKGDSVIEAAFNACYDSPEAFSKSFKRFHGLAPKDARDETGKQLRYIGPMTVNLSIENREPLLIANKEFIPSLHFIGKTISVPIDMKSYDSIIDNFWNEEISNGHLNYLNKLYRTNVCVGVSFEEAEDSFIYGIGVLSTSVTSDKSEFDIRNLSNKIWAKFKVDGLTEIHFRQTRSRILSEWAFISRSSIDDYPEIEHYRIDTEGHERAELWLPTRHFEGD